MVDVYISPSVQHFNLGVNGYGSEEERMNEIADIVEYELNRHGLVTDRNSPNMTCLLYTSLIERLRRENREFFCYCDGGLMYEHVDKLRPQVEYFHSSKALIKGNVMTIPECPRVNTYYGDEEELKYVRSICPDGLYSTANSGILDYMPLGLNKFSCLLYTSLLFREDSEQEA